MNERKETYEMFTGIDYIYSCVHDVIFYNVNLVLKLH